MSRTAPKLAADQFRTFGRNASSNRFLVFRSTPFAPLRNQELVEEKHSASGLIFPQTNSEHTRHTTVGENIGKDPYLPVSLIKATPSKREKSLIIYRSFVRQASQLLIENTLIDRPRHDELVDLIGLLFGK